MLDIRRSAGKVKQSGSGPSVLWLAGCQGDKDPETGLRAKMK